MIGHPPSPGSLELTLDPSPGRRWRPLFPNGRGSADASLRDAASFRSPASPIEGEAGREGREPLFTSPLAGEVTAPKLGTSEGGWVREN